jgi:hypothetical protein
MAIGQAMRNGDIAEYAIIASTILFVVTATLIYLALLNRNEQRSVTGNAPTA